MKLFKRTLALLLAAMLIFGLLPAQALAEDWGGAPGGEPIDNGEYVYTITAAGATIQWCYQQGAVDLVIPDMLGDVPVVAIGDGMVFSGDLRSVTIPDTVRTIGMDAFTNCHSLISVTIGSGVTSIGNNAFADCGSIRQVYYNGTWEQWDEIEFGFGNETVLKAECVKCIPSATEPWDLYIAYFPEEQRYVRTGSRIDTTGLELIMCYSDGSTELITEGYVIYMDTVYEWGAQQIPVYYEGLHTMLDVHGYIEGSCGNGLSFVFGPAGDLSISGDGAMYDYDPGVAPWFVGSYQTTIVNVGEGVEYIGRNAFYGLNNADMLVEVMLPISLKEISDNAFNGSAPLHINYAGSRQDWENITIGAGNEPLNMAEIHYGIGSPEKLYISKTPNKTEYTVGEELDTTGLELELWYDDGLLELITEGFEISGFDSTVPGTITVTVTYGELETTFDVTVLSSVTLVDSGTCGDNLTWTLDEEGTLTISGTGAMYDFDYAPWESYKDQIYTVQIGDGVTTIGSNAFYDHWRLTSPVNIPEGVTSIGSGAFYNTYMTSVTIPDGVESIGKDAFGWCGALTELILPDSVKEIGDYAFAWCNGVTTVKLSNQLTAINAGVFQGCVLLQSIEIPQSVTKLGDGAFESCGLRTVDIPAGVTEIGSCVFQASQLEQITVPNGVTRIGEYAFSNCYWLKSVELPDSLKEIGNNAFGQCSELTSVTIPGSLTTIGEYVFIYCSALTEIIIENGVTTIGNYAFSNMPALASVTIPASVTSIGEGVFYNCFSLSDVYYGGTKAQWEQICIEAENDILESATIHYAEAGPEIVASGTCGDDLTWTLDEEGTLTISGTGAMYDFYTREAPWYDYCVDIKAVNIGSEVTSIGNNAFVYCTALSSVTIPGNVKTIGDSAFSNCTSLTSITIADGVELIDDYTFYYTRLSSVTVPGSVKSLGRCAFALSALKSVTLCEGVETIGIRAFEHCSGITEISIPSTVTSIGERAFFGNSVMTLTIPEGVTYLESYVFGNCKSMTSLYLPASLTAVADYAAYGCSGLTDVYFAGRKAQWNAITFGYGNTYMTETATLHCAIPSVIVDVAVAVAPDKLAYFLGEPLETTGLILSARYDDGEVVEITEGFCVEGYDAYTDGKQKLTVVYENYSTYFYVTVQPIVAAGIEIESVPYRYRYFVGDPLDTYGLSLRVTYNNGDVVAICDGFETTGYDPYVTGEQCVTVTYDGLTTYFYVMVEPIVATWLSVDTMPYKMQYFVGEQLDLSGLSLYVTYNNGGLAHITEGYEVSGFDPNMTGEQCVTITFEGQSTYFYLMVQPIMPIHMYVDKMPDRTAYFVGDQLDTTGMSLTVTYNNGTMISVTDGFAVEGFDPYMTGEQCVWVYYEGQSTFFYIRVSPIEVTHIAVDAMPNKMFYYVGEELDTTGMTLMVHYNNGNVVSVPDGFEVTGFDPNMTGEQCVTIYYQGKSAYFFVRVEPIVVTYVGVETLPHKTVYFVGEELDTTGLVLAANYNNGTVISTADNFYVEGYDPQIAGEQCVTVTFEGHSTYFYVMVQPVVVTNVEIETMPNKTAYLTGEQLDTAGLALRVTYNNGEVVSVADGFEVSGFDSETPAKQRLTVSYEGFTANFYVTVQPAVKFEIVKQPENVEITAGFVANFTVEATEVAAYKWQYRRNEDAPWVNTTLPGNRTATLSVPAVLSRNGYQYRCRITGNNGRIVCTEAATLTVFDSIIISEQPMRQIVNVDSNATFTVVAEGAGLTYQWLYRKSDDDFWKQTGMTGNKTPTLTVPAAITRNGYQYMCGITDENNVKVYTKVAVLSAIGFTVQPEDKVVPADTDAVFAVEAKGQNLTYKWQYRKSATGSWLSTSLPGFDTNTLTVKATASRNGYQYRCGITDALGTLVYSDVATLTIGTPAQILTQPADQVVPVSLNGTFTVVAAGDGLSYQWQYRKNATDSWKNTGLTGYNTDTLTVEALEDRHGYQYRCVIKDARGLVVTTDPATLSVRTTLLIHTQPTNQTVPVDTDAVFSLFATGIGVTYKWQYREPGGTWFSTSLPGFDTNTLTVAAIATRNNYQYRCQLTDANGNTLQSHTVTLVVEIPDADAAIVAQPENQTVNLNDTAIFAIEAVGEGLTYQWQYQKDGSSSNWLNTGLTGATTATLSVPAIASRNGYRYRCVITDAQGNTLISDTASLTVNDPRSSATITSQTGDLTVTAGTKASFTVEATGNGLTYQWQYCGGPDKSWQNTGLTGNKTKTLTVDALESRNGYQYRCVITDANGYVINSEIVTLTVE